MDNDKRLRAFLSRHRPTPSADAPADLAGKIWRRMETRPRPRLMARLALSSAALAAVVLIYGAVLRQRTVSVDSTVTLEAANGIQTSLGYLPAADEQEEAFSDYLALADATE